MNLPGQLLRRITFVCVSSLIVFALASLSVAQVRDFKPDDQNISQQSSMQTNGSRRIRILQISEGIKIDGRLDAPVWSQAEAAKDFRQESPTEGAPASEKTEVRILYDIKNIYIGIRAFDSEPAKINGVIQCATRRSIRTIVSRSLSIFITTDGTRFALRSIHWHAAGRADYRRRQRYQSVVGRRVDFVGPHRYTRLRR
jgi:hypothetical protein